MSEKEFGRSKLFDDWHDELLRRNPNFAMELAALLSRRGAKRKIPLLCHENVHDLIEELRATKYFRIHALSSGSDDAALWQEAHQKRLWLLTADLDFWNDAAFPLHKSPGVIIVRGRTPEQRIDEFATLVGFWDLKANYARFQHGLLEASKTRVSSKSIEHKFRDGATTVTQRFRLSR